MSDVLAQILAKAIESNPGILTALMPTLAQAQSAPAKPKAQAKGKVKPEDRYRKVGEWKLTEYLTVEMTVVRKDGEGYLLVQFNNPQRQNGREAYGKFWGYKAEWVALCNWLRSTVCDHASTLAVQAGLTAKVVKA